MNGKDEKKRGWINELDTKKYKALIDSLDTDAFIDENTSVWGRLYSAMNKIEDRKISAWREQKEKELLEWKLRRADFSNLLESLEAHSPNQEMSDMIQEIKEKYIRTTEEQLRAEDDEEEAMKRIKSYRKIYHGE